MPKKKKPVQDKDILPRAQTPLRLLEAAILGFPHPRRIRHLKIGDDHIRFAYERCIFRVSKRGYAESVVGKNRSLLASDKQAKEATAYIMKGIKRLERREG